MDTFDIQDELYLAFTNDDALMEELGNPIGHEAKNLRFRREELMLSELTAEILPFITFVFIDSIESKNMLRNRGILEVNIYCSSQYQAGIIYRRLKDVLKQLYDIQLIHEGQVSSGVSGIYCYRTRFKLLVNS